MNPRMESSDEHLRAVMRRVYERQRKRERTQGLILAAVCFLLGGALLWALVAGLTDNWRFLTR